ncbi:MAG: hypothetical protein ACOCWZ_11345 [Spirochaetota bacterium]
MKRLPVILAVLMLAFSMACYDGDDDSDGKKAAVRFQNASDDIVINYGIKLGGAAYVGSLSVGQYTGYYNTSPGSYSVQLRDGSGNWITDSMGSFVVEDGHDYTVVLDGNINSYMYYLILDN